MPLSKLSLLCFESSIFLREDILNMRDGVQEAHKDRHLNNEFRNLYEDYRRHPDKFYSYTGVSVNTFDYILHHIDEHLIWQMRSKRLLTKPEKLFLTLRYLAHGLSFKSLSHSYRLGRSTVGKIIYETLNVIWVALKQVHMPQPSENDFRNKSDDFFTKWQFPNCIGAIGTKNFPIMKSPHSDNENRSSKKHFTLVLQAISDADYKFTGIEIGEKECPKDPFDFSTSKLKNLLVTNKFNVPPSKRLPGSDLSLPHVLVGNAEYPLKTYLMRPYPTVKSDPGKKIFNERLSRARATIDFVFGVFTNKWRIFQKNLETNTKHATLIIKGACLLHNIVRDLDGNNDKDFKECSSFLSKALNKKVKKSKRNGRASVQAIATRDKYKDYFVNNPIETYQLPT